jgi:hypothetical protein
MIKISTNYFGFTRYKAGDQNLVTIYGAAFYFGNPSHTFDYFPTERTFK